VADVSADSDYLAPDLPDQPGDTHAEQVLRDNRTLELRMAGATPEQIAKVVGWDNETQARAAINRALARDTGRLAEKREEYRAVQVARTERLLNGVWRFAIKGDRDAINAALKIMERQAKLLGLDAPTQVSISEDTRSQVLRLLDDLEHDIIPGEIVVPPLEVTAGERSGRGSGPGSGRVDQKGTVVRAGVGHRSQGADRGDRGAPRPDAGGRVGPLPVADTAAAGADDGHVADAWRSRDW
jgi:hypothetical protein